MKILNLYRKIIIFIYKEIFTIQKMVILKGKKLKHLDDEINKTVKLGNDDRQFILRIPTKISDNSILKSFKSKYIAEVIINTKKPDQIIINLKKNGRT